MKKILLILGLIAACFPSISQVTLPLDFESTTVNYAFTDFAGGAVTIIDNNQPGGINTSTKVAKMVKGAGQVYGGSFISLANPIDFSTNRTFKMKVFSPRVGAKFLLKVENQTNAGVYFEKEAICTVANAWEDLSFDYSAISTTNQYQKMVFIFDNGMMGDGSPNFTYYFDDVRLVAGGGGGTTLTQMNLPVTFDLTTVDYGLIGFGGAEQSSIVADPTNASNKVAKVIKSSAAELWAGTTITASAGLGFATRIPFTASNTKMSVRVWSPDAGIPVRLKVEEHGDPTHSVETEATVTTAAGWQVLEFNFANQAPGTAALNLSYNFDKASIFFNFGTTGAQAGEKTYYFDDVQFVTGGGGTTLTQMNLPVTFDLTTVDYGLIGFGGAEQSSIVADPTNASNKVAKVIKSATAELWAGTTITAAAGLGFATRIPFTASNTKMSVRVWSPHSGIPVRLKAEEHGDPTHSVETEATVTTASGWQTLEFNFASQSSGTSALNLSYNYDKVSIFFNFGTTGAQAGEKTYYFDDVQFISGGGGGALTQMDLPVTFDLSTVDYGLIGFGGAEQSSIVADPTNASNKVAKVIKTATAELWAGTTITAAAGLGFATRIPFTASNKKMSVRVWSPNAGIPVRLKAEEHGDPSHSVETEATVTAASGWQTLEFNFANQSSGTSALNLAYNYDKVSIFFNFGTTGAQAGEKIYYFDDVQFITGGGGGGGGTTLTQMDLPVSFDLSTVDYGLIGFGGAEQSSVVTDPTNASNKVAKVIKSATAELWAGTTITAAAGLGFTNRIPFTAANTKMTVRVWSPNAGIPVRLKAEEHGNNTHTVETESIVTVAAGWQILEFDFGQSVPGTSPLNLSYNYDKVSIFFNFGTTGAVAGEKIYYFDDVKFASGGGLIAYPVLPLDFQSPTINYGFVDFDGGAAAVINNPQVSGINTSSKVARMIKNPGQVWGGSLLILNTPIDFSVNRMFKMKVFSPRVGAKVLLKVENLTDASVNYEKETTITVANAWEELSFDFNAINYTNQYQKVVFIFDNGTIGDGSSNFTFLFDDVKLVYETGSVSTLNQMDLPLTFDDSNVEYGLIGFGGAEQSSVVADPTNATNKVGKVVKSSTASATAGTTISAAAGLGFVNHVPFNITHTSMSVRVWSPDANIPVRLRLEDHTDATHSVETEATITTASGWQTLVFNFAQQVSGTSPLNLAYNYDKATLYFNHGTTGATAGEKTYYFDDMKFISEASPSNSADVLNQVIIYPNPSADFITVRNDYLTPMNIRVFDAAGKLVKLVTSSVTNVEIDMSNLSSGVYMLNIENKLNGKSITKKVIKR